jgi:hypothetical protein
MGKMAFSVLHTPREVTRGYLDDFPRRQRDVVGNGAYLRSDQEKSCTDRSHRTEAGESEPKSN